VSGRRTPWRRSRQAGGCWHVKCTDWLLARDERNQGGRVRVVSGSPRLSVSGNSNRSSRAFHPAAIKSHDLHHDHPGLVYFHLTVSNTSVSLHLPNPCTICFLYRPPNCPSPTHSRSILHRPMYSNHVLSKMQNSAETRFISGPSQSFFFQNPSWCVYPTHIMSIPKLTIKTRPQPYHPNLLNNQKLLLLVREESCTTRLLRMSVLLSTNGQYPHP
jgi:hypothetical protein